jgi:acetyltransferase-like isoleucine patch superfamily enzyme
MSVISSTRERLRARVVDFIRAANQPAEVMQRPGDLLAFPEQHSYLPPTLLAFGHEPGVTECPWVRVGKYCSINGGTRVLLGGGHHPEWVSTYPFRIKYDLPGKYEDDQPWSRGPVTIGDDVWIGYDVVIQSGVTIGAGAVVATGTLVRKDVEPYALVGGNPGQQFGYRFDPDTIAALLRIRWWDWPDEKVLANVDALCSPDLSGFIAKHDR